ncbi:MAG: hypothetical protein IKH08_02240 [Prevotella sp.]|nr:hypothetical protein [Prevotella sp.]
MKFGVTCTRIYNGWLEVEAASEEEAVSMAQERMDEVDWDFGEQTADYADKITEDDECQMTC